MLEQHFLGHRKRHQPRNRNRWILPVCVLGSSADAFLGTQGYQWDTQTDMAMALLGAVTALLTLARIHDRQLEQL